MSRSLLCLLVSASLLQAADFYVSPTGNDTAAGGEQAPFATMARAQQAVRALRQAEPQRTEPVEIEVRGGLYTLAEPIRFLPEDAGRPQSETIYRARQGETPVFSGGVRLTGWQVRNGRWELPLPEVKAGNWRFSQLFVNGQRRLRPRFPKGDGFYYITRPIANEGTGSRKGNNRFRFRAGDLDPDWHNLSDIEILVFHNWSMSRIPLQSVDAERKVATLAGFTWHESIAALTTGRNYIVENVREALSDAGEWYLDRTSGILTYIPMPGETPETTEVVAPKLDYLLGFEGDGEKGLTVDHVRVQGLTFEHTNWNVPADGYCVPQSEVSGVGTQGQSPFPVAVRTRWARRVGIESCTVRHTGFYGVEFGEGSQSCELLDTELWDLGAGGVMVGTTRSFPVDSPRLPRGHLVQNCMVAHGGRIHPAGTGIWIGHAADNRVLNNDVFDFYYSAVSVGWSWSYGFSPAKRNLVSQNHLYQIGQKRLSDLGGVYTLGVSEGTVLSYNRIHDVSRVHYGGSGIYFDQGSSGITVENNIVYRTQDAGFTVHWAQDDLVRNNIFAYGDSYQLGIGRTDKSGAMAITGNIVLWKDSRATSKRDPREDWVFSRNLYWASGGPVDGFGKGVTFPEWQESGHDQDSIAADPKFRDPENGDFTLADDSPALALGFKPIDATHIGRRTPTRRPTDSPAVPHTYPAEGDQPPLELSEDFEEYTVGDKPSLMHTYENNERESATVSDLQAASGSKSLRIVDGPGPGPSYNPHVFYQPGYKDGRVQSSFRLYLETPVRVGHAWRDGSSAGFKTGPSLDIHDGKLFAGKRELMPLPLGTWITFEIDATLGEANKGTFELSVKVGEAPAKTFTDLPCDPLCRELNWLGWTAGETKESVFYLDDISVHPLAE
jgi:hypothetical protein